MLPSTSQVDLDKLPSTWTSYLEKVKQPHEPDGEGHVLNSACSQKLVGNLWWFGNTVDMKDR